MSPLPRAPTAQVPLEDACSLPRPPRACPAAQPWAPCPLPCREWGQQGRSPPCTGWGSGVGQSSSNQRAAPGTQAGLLRTRGPGCHSLLAGTGSQVTSHAAFPLSTGATLCSAAGLSLPSRACPPGTWAQWTPCACKPLPSLSTHLSL